MDKVIDPLNALYGKCGLNNIWAKAYYKEGAVFAKERGMKALRKEIEKYGEPQGMSIYQWSYILYMFTNI